MDKLTQPSAITWPGLMASKEIVKTAKISRAHLYAMLARGQFPQPALRCGPRFTRWKASDVQAWLADPQGWITANAKSSESA
jgi:predicted DNA-binding transcriptional regulator AlpA